MFASNVGKSSIGQKKLPMKKKGTKSKRGPAEEYHYPDNEVKANKTGIQREKRTIVETNGAALQDHLYDIKNVGTIGTRHGPIT